MRLSSWSLAGLLALAGCSSYAPPAELAGMTRDQVVARMGAPDTQQQRDGGTRLEYPHGPFGKHTWFVYLDSAGIATRAEQVLTEANFNRVTPGMDQDAVRNLLGRPGETYMLGRSRGMVWSYRYESALCQWFQVEISDAHQVRSAGYGTPPECERRDRIIFP